MSEADDCGDRGSPLESELCGASDVDHFCAEFGVRESEAIEMLHWMDSHMPVNGVNLVKLRELDERYRHATGILEGYLQNQHANNSVMMTVKSMRLALGHISDSEMDIARGTRRSKQAVHKCLETILEKLRLGPTPGQRNGEARAHMKSARIKQLKKA